MADQVQLRRGTATQHNSFTGAIGEVTYVTDTKTLRAHDGFTAGGNDPVNASNVTAAGALMDSELANIGAVKALNQGVATTDSPTFNGVTSTNDYILNNTVASNQRAVQVQTEDSKRWRYGADSTAEAGSNSGSSWVLEGYSDAGAYLGVAFSVRRSDLSVGLGSVPTAGYRLSCFGKANFQGEIEPTVDNTYTCGSASLRWSDVYAASGSVNTSDLNEKEQISDLSLGTSFLNTLRPVSFVWKDTPASKDINGKDVPPHVFTRQHWGLIAQDVKNALDNAGIDGGVYIDPAVNGGSGPKGLRYSELIPVLIKSIQELNARMDAAGI